MNKLLKINIFLLLVLCGLYLFNESISNKIFNKFEFAKNTSLIADANGILGKIQNNTKINTKNNTKNETNLNNVDYGIIYNDVLQMIKANYVEDVKDKEFFESSLSGMLSALDPHSAYFTKEEYSELMNDTKGQFSGLGIEVTMENSMVKVVSPIDEGPAFKQGVKTGDYISNIDDKSVIGMTLLDAVKLMRGKDEKDKGIVKLTILRIGEKEPKIFKIKRDIIKTDSVKGRAEGEIIYLRISSFTEQTYTDLIKAFNKIENEIDKGKVRGLVLDLRNNPGGLLDTAVFVSDAFLDKGQKIVSISGKNKKLIKDYKAQSEQNLIPNLPMAVLINEGSASASEIVAGALQDNKRAIIVGTKSFGKGSVQSVIGLKEIGGIKLTIARYYTPSGNSIQAEGIKPDIEVQLAKIEPIDASNWNTNENSLKGHLNNDNEEKTNNNVKTTLKGTDIQTYNKDYQLARALDLILGIDFYNKNTN